MAGAAIANSLTKRANRPRTAADIVTPVVSAVTCGASNFIADTVAEHVNSSVVQQVATHVGGQVWRMVNDQIARHHTRPIASPSYGQHDAPWLAFYDALGQCGMDVSPLDGVTEIAASCGWWWPFDDVCVLSERHSLLARDERGRLHASNGPAVGYPDGWVIYARHGVRVPPVAVLYPASVATISSSSRLASTLHNCS
jgi:hypothetical protein